MSSHQSFSRAAELNKQAGVYSKKNKQASGLALVSFGLLETKAQLRVCVMWAARVILLLVRGTFKPSQYANHEGPTHAGCLAATETR